MTASRLVAARKRPLMRMLGVAGLLIAIACVSVAIPIKHYPYPSPIDEMVHFDYILAIPDAPVTGDKIAPTTMREWACRTSGPEFVLSIPACNQRPYEAQNFPGEGWSTAGGHPPFYYAVTALATRPVAKLTGWSIFTLGRAFGAFWLAFFMWVCFAIARRLGAGAVPALAAAVLVGTSPGVVSSAATMGPDTATAAMSGLVLLAALAFDGSRRSTLLFLAAVLLASLTKLTAFEAVGAAFLFLCLRPLGWGRHRESLASVDSPAVETTDAREPAAPSLRTSMLTGGLGVIVFVIVSVLWALRTSMTATVDPSAIAINQMFVVETLDWASISEALVYTFTSPGTGNWMPSFLTDPTNFFVLGIVAALGAVATLAAALAVPEQRRVGSLGVGLLVMVLAAPFMLTALNFYVNDQYFLLPQRQGYGLLAGIVAAIAWLMQAPGTSRALAILAVLSVVNILT